MESVWRERTAEPRPRMSPWNTWRRTGHGSSDRDPAMPASSTSCSVARDYPRHIVLMRDPTAAPRGSTSLGPAWCRSADDERTVAGGDHLADHRMAGQLADDEQAAGGLGIRQEHQLVLVQIRVEVVADPVEVAAA